MSWLGHGTSPKKMYEKRIRKRSREEDIYKRSYKVVLPLRFQSDMCAVMILAACSAECCRPIASTKSLSGSVMRNRVNISTSSLFFS